MSNIQYGLINRTDANILEKTIDLICESMDEQTLNITEVGLFNCETSAGIIEYIVSKQRWCNYTGIDNEKDKQIEKPEWMTLILGNSTEVYNALPDNSQHLIFVDSNHSFPSVVADYFCYAPKVKKGGFICFHDTAPHIQQFKDWQRMGSEGDADMYISVRKALQTIGLLEPFTNKNYKNVEGGIYDQWQLIFDEADPNDEAGGVTVFRKLY